MSTPQKSIHRAALACAMLATLAIPATGAERMVSVAAYFHPLPGLGEGVGFGEKAEELPVPSLAVQTAEGWVDLDSAWGQIGRASMLPVGTSLEVRTSPGDGRPPQTQRLPITPGCTSLLLMVMPEARGGSRVIPVEGNPDRLATGHVHFINAGDEPVMVNAGDKTKTLSPRELWSIPASAALDLEINTRIAARIKEQWRLVYRRKIFVDPQKRYIFLVHRQGLDATAWSTTLLDFSPPPPPPIQSTEEEP